VGIAHAINPYCYRCPLGLKLSRLRGRVRQGRRKPDPDGHKRPDRRVHRRTNPGSGGFITPPPEYFKIVFKAVKKYGGLFISDEVQTGFGRTGKKWFGIEHWEVTPTS